MVDEAISELDLGTDFAGLFVPTSDLAVTERYPFLPDTSAIITAAGTVQGDAAALTGKFNVITTATVDQGVKLVSAFAGAMQQVYNATAVNVKFYPNTGDILNEGTVNLPINLSAGATIIVFAPDTTNWYGKADFETGPWLPGLQFGGASIGVTYSDRAGSFTIASKRCFIDCSLSLTNKGSSTGSAEITNLPVACVNRDPAGGGLVLVTFTVSGADDGPIICRIRNGTTVVNLLEQQSAGVGALTNSNFNNTSTIHIKADYEHV